MYWGLPIDWAQLYLWMGLPLPNLCVSALYPFFKQTQHPLPCESFPFILGWVASVTSFISCWHLLSVIKCQALCVLCIISLYPYNYPTGYYKFRIMGEQTEDSGGCCCSVVMCVTEKEMATQSSTFARDHLPSRWQNCHLNLDSLIVEPSS